MEEHLYDETRHENELASINNDIASYLQCWPIIHCFHFFPEMMSTKSNCVLNCFLVVAFPILWIKILFESTKYQCTESKSTTVFVSASEAILRHRENFKLNPFHRIGMLRRCTPLSSFTPNPKHLTLDESQRQYCLLTYLVATLATSRYSRCFLYIL